MTIQLRERRQLRTHHFRPRLQRRLRRHQTSLQRLQNLLRRYCLDQMFRCLRILSQPSYFRHRHRCRRFCLG
jgi:hypothetical protein